jgi:hypothetical protein
MRMITTADYRADQEESFAHNIGCGAAYSSLDPRFAKKVVAYSMWEVLMFSKSSALSNPRSFKIILVQTSSEPSTLSRLLRSRWGGRTILPAALCMYLSFCGGAKRTYYMPTKAGV